MIDLIDINEKRYPFLFSMDVVWYLSGSGKIEIEEKKTGEQDKDGKDITQTKITAKYDDLIELYLIANDSAIEYQGKGARIDAKTLKNGIRKDPKLFITLQNKLAESEALKVFADLNDDKKKK